MQTIQAIVGTITTNLNSGALRLEEADGLFDESPARRLSDRGPEQHGDTDLDVRLDPRYITMRFNAVGTSQAALEALRDTLRATFKPTPSTPVKIRVTRDDGSVRQIDVHREGPVAIPLKLENRPGNLNRAVVQLKASDPNFYDPTVQGGTIIELSDWWRAYNTIGSASVLEHTEAPGTAQAWTYGGTITGGSPWMIAFRSAPAGLGGSAYAFESGFSLGRHYFAVEDISNLGTAYAVAVKTSYLGVGTSMMEAGTHNYFLIANGGTTQFFRDTTLIAERSEPALTYGTPNLVGVGGRWRSSATPAHSWPVAIPRAAIFNIAPTPTQLAALSDAMQTGGSVRTTFVNYAGDWPEYPIVRINGPISDPIVTNTSTGETLDFTGHSIGSADYYEIDTRGGYKTVRNSGGDIKIGDLSEDSDLETFHLAPDQEATGGVNVLVFSGTAIGTATNVVVTYYNRYTGF